MDKQLIDIQDLDLLKITKVKKWSINFDYGNTHYLLHGSTDNDYDTYNTLYIRTLNRNGKYELEVVKSDYCYTESVINIFIKPQKGRTIVYKNIDKEYFAYKLTEQGYATGIMENKVKERKYNV